MNKYDTDKIRTLPILDVAEALGIDVKKKGRNWMACCQWHQDSHPSMVVGGNDHNTCHCFVCGQSWGVIDLVKQVRGVDFLEACKWLEERYCIPTPTLPRGGGRFRNSLQLTRAKGSRLKVEHKDTEAQSFYFSKEWVMARMNLDNSFARCMVEVFGKEMAVEVMMMYRLCSIDARYGVPNVGFPLIDRRGNILDIKVQGYEWDTRSEQFFHRDKAVCYWLGPKLAPTERLLKGQSVRAVNSECKNNVSSNGATSVNRIVDDAPSELNNDDKLSQRPSRTALSEATSSRLEDTTALQDNAPDNRHTMIAWMSVGQYANVFKHSCLFGEHLLPLNPDCKVALVESPKNACIGYAWRSDWLWLATGNKAMLTKDILAVLSGRTVIVIPDEDAYDEWSKKISQMKDLANFCIIHPPGTGEKRDIADWILQIEK